MINSFEKLCVLGEKKKKKLCVLGKKKDNAADFELH